ncbi:MAG: LamG domain-containing protein [Lentisphaeria bacterium]
MSTVQHKWMRSTKGISLTVLLTSVPAWAGYMETVVADNPIAYYRLGETTGTAAANLGSTASSASYVNSPTLGTVGAIVSDSAANRAVTLNGSTQGIRLDNAGQGTPFEPNTSNLTLELWMKTTSTTNSRLLSWYAYATGGAASGGQGLYGLYFYDDGRVSFDVRGDENKYRSVIASTVNVRDGYWHQVVGVLNRTANTISIYVDGQLINTGFTTSPTPALTTITSSKLDTQLTMGYQNSTSPIYFSGSLDEVAVYRTALTDADILEHYTAAIPEPAAIALLLLGAGLLAGQRWRPKA